MTPEPNRAEAALSKLGSPPSAPDRVTRFSRSVTILDALEAAEKAATPGRWFWDSYAGIHSPDENMESDGYVPIAEVNTGYDGSRWREDGKANAALIALLRNHAADLNAVARAAQDYASWPDKESPDLAALDHALAPLLKEAE